MELGLKRDEVRLVPFTTEWKGEFLHIQQDLIDRTGLEQERIQHIGSTALEGIYAKPIIDMVMGIENIEAIEAKVKEGLKEVGFLRLKVERPGEIVYAKFKDPQYEVKTHYIHLMEYQGELWRNLIFFRDYLNDHEQVKREYEHLKLAFLREQHKAGIVDYTNYKEAFVKKVYQQRG